VTVRVGIVGSGYAASMHAQGLRQTPGADILAVASLDPEHAWVFAHTFGIRHAFIDYRDMLEGDLVDAVTIACPNDRHCEVALAAAAAGKHVLVEKPMALNLADCDRMVNACRQAGVVLMYGENLIFAPAYAGARRLIESGALGNVYYVRQVLAHGGPHADWFWDIERSGGGALIDLGAHSIAVARWLLGGRVESVSAELGRHVHTRRQKCEDQAIVTLRNGRGGVAVAEASWARPGGLDSRVEVYGSEGQTSADAARGSALATFSGPGFAYATGEDEPEARGWGWAPLEEAWRDGFPQEMAHFVACVREGRRPALSGEDGRGVLEIVCAAYQSARSGQRVPLPFETEARLPVELWLGE
jgi:predicted dehydrogenase